MPPAPDPNADWWTTSDVAAHIGVTVRSVSAMRTRGLMPDNDDRVVGKRVWRPATIIEWHAQRPRATRPKVVDRYQAGPGEGGEVATPFSRDRGTTWTDPTIHVTSRYRVGRAGRIWAPLLGIGAADRVLVRHYSFFHDGQPQQQSRSALPFDLVEGTPLTDRSLEPWAGGTRGQMQSIGVEVTAVDDKVSARLPTERERDELAVPDGVPVFDVTRVHLTGTRPVEAALIVIPADRVRFHYLIGL